MAQDLPFSVAEALTVPPLDKGSVLAGHRGLSRSVLWVDIMHAPAESFIRAGDLVLTTGADTRQVGVREFLTFAVTSPAAGLVLSPPRDIPVDDLLASLIPLADRHAFPVVLLPWEVPFAEVMRSLLPRLTPTPPDVGVRMVIGRRERDDAAWNDLASAFADAVVEIGGAEGLSVRSSVTDDLVMSHFSAAPSTSRATEIVSAAQAISGIPDGLVNWVLLPPERDRGVMISSAVPRSVPEGPVGPRQFAEVLSQHPRSMATILRTLQPLVEYDDTRRGQLVRTLEVLLEEGTNTSAAARRLYLNRHSLLYRIKLIEDLTGLSLKKPADRFQLEVSVRVHQLNSPRPDGFRGGDRARRD